MSEFVSLFLSILFQNGFYPNCSLSPFEGTRWDLGSRELKDDPFRLREPADVPCDFTQPLRKIYAHPYLPPPFLCVAFSCLSLGLHWPEMFLRWRLDFLHNFVTAMASTFGQEENARPQVQKVSLPFFFKFGRRWFNYGSTSKSL